MNSGVAGGLDVGSLRAGPILVMADGEKHLVVGQQVPSTVSVDSGGVGDIVAVCLQPPNHWILRAEQPIIRRFAGASDKGAVVADFISAAGGGSRTATGR